MTVKKTTTPIKGDISFLKKAIIGPFDIYLPTGNLSEDGTLIMESYINWEDEPDERAELDKEPFCQVWFRKHYITPAREEESRKIDEEFSSEDNSRLLAKAVRLIPMMVAKWSLTENGVDIPVTAQAITEHDIPAEILYTIMGKFYEVGRPPKASSGKLPSISSQEE